MAVIIRTWFLKGIAIADIEDSLILDLLASCSKITEVRANTSYSFLEQKKLSIQMRGCDTEIQ